jgi:hypothetical protein
MLGLRCIAWVGLATLFTACSSKPIVKSDVDVDQMIQGKTKVTPEQHEAVPATYFELAAWTNDLNKEPSTTSSATGALGPGSVVACVSATEKNEKYNNGRCEITISAGTFSLKYRQTVTSNGSGEVKLACSGDSPAACRAWVVN